MLLVYLQRFLLKTSYANRVAKLTKMFWLATEESIEKSSSFWSARACVTLAAILHCNSGKGYFNMFTTARPSWLAALPTDDFATHELFPFSLFFHLLETYSRANILHLN